MIPSHRLLLDIWREACRHIEISDALERIAPLLHRKVPATVIYLRRLIPDRRFIETVAEWSASDLPTSSTARAELPPAHLDGLLRWCQQQDLVHQHTDDFPAALRDLIPENAVGELVAVPLHGEQGVFGALLLLSSTRRSFREEHIELASAIKEPFTVALENDRRLHELVTLREKAEAENRSLLSKLGRTDLNETVVGEDSGLRDVMQRVSLVAAASVPVLLLGETGSGKEVVARAIHRQSNRQDGPFLRVNCGAIPPELVDSELFGHEKGSFTGAAAVRKGWFERADGGTLLLDECGELTPAAQVRLLRVLQDGTFERVGGERQLHVDVRVIAATHRNLKAMVAEGTFREDLLYRLAVLPIYLPPLRERPHDIPAMVAHFATRAAAKFGLKPCTATDDDLRLLVSYPWPGNVRELGAVIERAAILGQGQRLEVAIALGQPVAALPLAIEEPKSSVLTVRTAVDGPFPTLDDALRRHIEQALKRTLGRIEGKQGAAKLLGINPHTLRARMRKLGVPWQDFR